MKFQGLSTLSTASSQTAPSSVRTQSQTVSSLTSDSFDIDWEEVMHEDANVVAEQVEKRWEKLLDRLQQVHI